ncbi:MAG: hypothetical protein HY774_01385 [Acidobacteria bacterium]|nr:hypothetical protein [Acidobacteriota bacterium]
MFGSSGTSVRLYRRRLPVMFLAVLLASLQLSMGLPWRVLANANDETAKPTSTPPPTPKVVTVNKTVPKVEPPPATPVFSKVPTSTEITRARVFNEPLIPFGSADKSREAQENLVLAQTITDYLTQDDWHDVSRFEAFLTQFPMSVWRVSLLTNMGFAYRYSGYFQKALDTWEQAWKLGQHDTNPDAQAIAHQAVAQLAELQARLGRYEQLEPLFAELKGRNIRGSVAETLNLAHEGLWIMGKEPGIAFRCGPYALTKVCSLNQINSNQPKLLNFVSTRQGTSLAQIARIAKEVGLKYHAARRTSADAPIPVPSVVHWNVGHFAALTHRVVDQTGQSRYVIQDPTFGTDVLVSEAALKVEASGYFLIPKEIDFQGWESVTESEAATVWGRGLTRYFDADRTTCPAPMAQESCGTCPGMPRYNFHLALVNLNLKDTPVGYSPPRGPSVDFTLTYNHREVTQPASFTFSNLGNLWMHNWLAYAQEDSGNPLSVQLYERGGGRETFTLTQATQSGIGFWSQSKLTRLPANAGFERLMPGGGKELYTTSDNGANPRFFLKKIIDPQGNEVGLSYDASMRLVSIADAIGQVTTLSYEHPTDSLKITKVTDPFGRFATFNYNASLQLSSITDVINLTTTFTYGASDFISAMQTPYGPTTFEAGQMFDGDPNLPGRRWVQATDPVGDTERLEFWHGAPDGLDLPFESTTIPGIDTSDLFVHFRDRSSYYFDKKAWSEAQNLPNADKYDKAEIIQWLRFDDHLTVSSVMYSQKKPLENRVWYNYPGQTLSDTLGSSRNPSRSGRLVNSNPLSTVDLTQLYQYEYNEYGHLTKMIDPFKPGASQGRRTRYVYAANGIDLLEVYQGTEGEPLANDDLTASYTYNSQHLPLTMMNAAKQTTTYTYNGFGQMLTATNAKNETTTNVYDSNGYLTSTTGPVTGSTTTYTYDGYGRVRTVTDSDGYTVTTDYDNLDRPTRVTYPDTTYQEMTYDKLDLIRVRDRLGRITETTYDAVQRVTSVKDPLNRITTFNWCNCGGLYQMTDAKNQTTTWNRDVQGRVTSKMLFDNKMTQYQYDEAGRVKQMTDAKNRTTIYRYFLDNNLYEVDYPSTLPTAPDVIYSYAPNYNRVIRIEDDNGYWIVYQHHPVTSGGQLGATQVKEERTQQGSVFFDYDQLGRVTTRTVEGVAETMTYDTLGRMTRVVNALGTFDYGFDEVTGRVTQVTGPNNLTSTFSYFGNNDDRRLQTILNKKGTTTLDRHDYTYDDEGRMLTWNQGFATADAITYDLADQLKTYSKVNSSGGPTLHTYNYDTAGNRTDENIAPGTKNFTYNNVNQMLTSQVGSGTIKNYVHDNNGNLTGDGTRTYEYNDRNDLTAIVEGTKRFEFTYDGLGRRYKMVYKTNGVTTFTRRFIWCGAQPCYEQYNTAGQPGATKRYFAQGVLEGSDKYFYMRDHLGSVREVMKNNNTTVEARYDYDPWGRQTQVTGTRVFDIGYAGYMVFAPTGTNIKLNLTWYRAYSPELGRWLSRDPIGEKGGINLYGYVNNRPITLKDSKGLCEDDCCKKDIQKMYEIYLEALQLMDYHFSRDPNPLINFSHFIAGELAGYNMKNSCDDQAGYVIIRLSQQTYCKKWDFQKVNFSIDLPVVGTATPHVIAKASSPGCETVYFDPLMFGSFWGDLGHKVQDTGKVVK